MTRSEGGFTLLELLIVVVLAGIVGATTMNLFRVQSRMFREENRTVEVDQNVRGGLDLMLRELRNAGMKDPLQAYASTPGVLTADSNAVRFTMDYTGGSGDTPDGDVTDANEDVEYSLTTADGTLRRRTRGVLGDSGAQPMAELITRLSLTYYDGAGAALAFPLNAAARASIRRIRVRIEGASPDGATQTVLESEVVPRNLGY